MPIHQPQGETKSIILCVDDEDVFLVHLATQLRQRFGQNYRIETACDGEEALVQIEEWTANAQTVAMVVSDLLMPRMSGDAFLVALHQKHPAIIKILLTGAEVDSESIIQVINRADLFRYLNKPWDKEDFMLSVEQGLQKFSLLRDLQAKVDEQTSALRTQHEQLQKQHNELKQAQAQLVQSEKIAALGILLTGVAHEIKNPAQFAYSGAQNLHRRLEQLRDFLLSLAEGDDESNAQLTALLEEKFTPVFQNLEAIQDGTQRIQLLAGNLHAFSRLSNAEEREPIQIGKGLRSTLSLVEANFRERVQFLVDIDFDPTIIASSARINQVLMNVTVNACQAIVSKQEEIEGFDRGTIVVQTFPLSRQEVFPNAANESARPYESEQMLGILLEDDGCGISPEHLEKIFEPFYSTKPEGQGSGLGLSIAWNIMQEHGGKIVIESTLGKGTKVLMYLPLTEDACVELEEKRAGECG